MQAFSGKAGNGLVTDQDGFAPLIGWLETCRFSDIPDETVTATKQCLLDGLACMLGGLQTQEITEYRRVLAFNSVGTTGLIPVSPECCAGLIDAVHIYAQAANVLDFDDCYRSAPSHPGATIIGPALACAHVLEHSGQSLLLAIAKAYEASLRIGTALCPSSGAPSKDIGYATWQIFGAYVAAGALLNLEREQWLQGFGLAAQQAPVPMIVRTNPQGGHSWLKNAYGTAAASGVLSAFLARQGYIGDQHFFSPEFGFWKIYGSDQFRPEYLANLPGDDWLIRDVEFKPWACCRWAQPAIELTLKIKHTFDVKAIQSIDIYSFRELCNTLDAPFPTNLIDAQFNLRFLIALALQHDDPNVVFGTSDLSSSHTKALFAKVNIHHDSECDAQRRRDMSLPTRLVVKLNNGQTAESTISEPLGSQSRGIASFEQTKKKFRGLLTPQMSERQIENILGVITSLESYTTRELMLSIFRQA